jgi:uncharacterized protein with PIN domain
MVYVKWCLEFISTEQHVKLSAAVAQMETKYLLQTRMNATRSVHSQLAKMDYAIPTFRKTKRDKKAKARYSKYKKGGHHRADNIVLTNKK